VVKKLAMSRRAAGGRTAPPVYWITNAPNRGDRENKCLETEIKHLFLEQNRVNKTNSVLIFQKRAFKSPFFQKKHMEMPLKRVFSPLTAHSGGQGPFLATIAPPSGTYVAMVPGLWRVSGIKEGKGALRGYKRY